MGYSLFMLLAMAVFLLVRWQTPVPRELARLPFWERALLLLAGFLGGMIGAKVPFIVGEGVAGLSSGEWLADGKTITTGLLGAYLAVEAAKIALGLRLKTGDRFAPAIAAALAVGRWGCFVNGCCYGARTTGFWGVDLIGDGPRYPTQVYESVFHAAMFALLLWLQAGDRLRTHRLQFYFIAYGLFRLASESLRPEPIVWAGMTFYQLVSLLMIVLMAAQWGWEESSKPIPSADLPMELDEPNHQGAAKPHAAARK
ncbi:prolipoprotein diacylglyceryl transferase [Lignipirellula cremea]|uniref:Prolipoprotein diacylglyceryl transferase n=1 Tax=Lignipirellula cremea TaxID=2528010 RepID=A0A518DU69_9BACT|nr:prolipoprotein diacylglyceryl transferase family protein [Lignipirellula cremea]QDU95383.1 prolipoprotein diacylglyceryl transferase [Lignipirellula cremea]